MINFLMFIFGRKRETECEWGRGRETERHRIWSRLQALSGQHRAQCRARTHKLRDHDLSWSRTLNQLSHPGTLESMILDTDFFFILNFFFFNVYFWDRERQSMNGGGSERGRHRIWNRLQALSCQHRAQRGARTHGSRDHDLSEVGCSTDWATQVPLDTDFKSYTKSIVFQSYFQE